MPPQGLIPNKYPTIMKRTVPTNLRCFGLFILLFLLSLPAAHAQFSTKHYLPPVWIGQTNNTSTGFYGNVELVVSTSTTNHDVAFTIKQSDGTLIDSATCISGTPHVENLGTYRNTYATPGIARGPANAMVVLNDKGLIVEADEPVCVNLRQIYAVTDKWSVSSKGETALGTDFRSGHMYDNVNRAAYEASNLSNVISIMATEDNTTVNIDIKNDGSVTLTNGSQNDTSIVLNAGQSFIVRAVTFDVGENENLNGTHITSDKNIAVISGTYMGSIFTGNGKNPADTGIDEIIPVNKLGSEHIIQYGKCLTAYSYDLGESANIVAAYDNTVVFIDGVSVDTLSAGENHREWFPTAALISGYPMVIQLREAGTGSTVDAMSQIPGYVYQESGGGVGERGMSIIPSLECKGTLYSEFLSLGTSANINIVTMSGATVKLGTTVLAPAYTRTLNSNDYDIYSVSADAVGVVEKVSSDKLMHVGMMLGINSSGVFAFFTNFTAPPLLQMGAVNYAQEDNYLYASGMFTQSEWFYNGKSLGIKNVSGTKDSIEVSLPGTYSVAFATTGCGWTDTSSVVVKPNPAGPYPGGAADDVLWLRADKEYSNASYWGNYAGHMYLDSVAQTTADNQPTWTDNLINFNPAYDFDGSNDRFEAYDYFKNVTDADISIGNGTDAKEVFAVSINESGTGTMFYLGDPVASNTKGKNLNFISNYSDNISVLKVSGIGSENNYAWINYDYDNVTTSTINVANPIINNYSLEDDAQVGNNLFSGNGSVLSTRTSVNAGTNVSLVPNITGHSAGVGFGSSWSSGYQDHFNGQIAEVIYFHDTLTTVERSKVNSYLAIKYGITLDMGVNSGAGQNYLASSGDTVWDASINTDYNHDIFGLALDSVSMLEQRISHSINATGVLTASLENNFVGPNSSLTATIANGDFTLFGNDAQPSTISKLDNLPDGYNIRSERTWLTQTTVAKNVYLKFDIKMDTDTKYYLAVRNGSDDFTGTAATLTSMNTDSTVNVTLNNGDYFTIVAYKPAPGGVLGSGRVNGVYYELYTGGYDSNPADGITGDLRTTGYFDDLTDFQALVGLEIGANYSIIAKTQLKVSTAGDYNLQFNSLGNDAGAIFVDGQLYSIGNAVALSVGYHNLEVRVSTDGGPNFEVQWRPDGGTYAAIADSLLFVDAVITSWHRADAQVTNTGEGTNATGWYDQSLSGNDLLATDQGYPTYYETTPAKMVNFNPTVEYANNDLNGDDDHSYGFSLGKQGKTTFIITSESKLGGWRYCTVYGGTANNTYFDVGCHNYRQNIGFAISNYQGSTLYYNKTGYYISAANYINPSLLPVNTKNVLGYVNSHSEASAVGSNAISVKLAAKEDFSIGGGFKADDADNPFWGRVSEVINYPWVLNDLERRKVETYLAVKYGITLDQSGSGTDYIASNGDTIWSVADNAATANSGAYNKNIFGLGRDDVEGLYQMVSHSIDTPQIDLVVAMDLDFSTPNTTRQAGAGSGFTAINNNISYLMISDNGGDTTFNNSIYNGQFYGMDHTWRFTQTNIGHQSVNLSFGTRYASNDSVKYYVVYKPGNDDFATGSYHHEIDDYGCVPNVSTSADGYFTIVRQKVSSKSPGGIDSERLWLRADKEVTSSGNKVSQWVDFSSNGYVFSQGTADKQPYYGDSLINFNYALAFDDDNGNSNTGRDYLTSNGDINKALYTQKQSVFVVAKNNETASTDFDYVFYMSSGEGTDQYDGNGTNTTSLFEESFGYTNSKMLNFSLQDGNVSAELQSLTGNVLADKPVMMTTHDMSNALSLSQNSASAFTATLSSSNTYASQYIRVGGHMGTTKYYRFFTGNIAEIIVYPDSVLNPTNIQQVESYLAVKYGLTLDQTVETDYLLSDGDPFWDASVATSAIASSSYNHDIFGLLRDDLSALYQRISHSVNGDAILTVSRENNFTDPNDTTYRKDSYIADKDYIMFSNNDSTVTVDKTTELPQGTSKRMAREWMVQKTSGFIGKVSLKFEGNFTITDPNERYILFGDIDGDGDFTTGVPRRLGTLDANGVVANVKFDSTITVITVAYAKDFAPGGIGSNLWLWMRADMGTSTITDGEDVNLWDEMGRGNLVEISETTPSNTNRLYTSNISNFNPAIKMVDADMDLLARDTVLAQDIYVVAQFTANTAYAGVVGINNLSTGTIIGVRSANPVDSDYNNTLVNGVDWSYNGVFRLNEKVGDFTHNNQLHLVNAQSAAPIKGPLYLGGYQAIDNLGFDGYISEVIAYSATQSDADRQKIQSYLALKYGISLDQTAEFDYVATDGTVMWDASASGDFKYDIFGLGRDETDSLYQRVSKSANATGVLTVSLNDDFTSANLAASRKADTIANLNFMTFSNNGGDTIADETTNLPAEHIAYGMERIWRVSETSTFPDSINMKFDVPNLNATTYLLYKTTGANGDFTGGAATYVGRLDVNGEISNVQLNNGEYFSLFVGRAPGDVADNLQLWLRADYLVDKWTSDNRWYDFHNMDSCDVYGATLTDSLRYNFNPGINFDGTDDYIDVYDGFADFREGYTSFILANIEENSSNPAGLISFRPNASDTINSVQERLYPLSPTIQTHDLYSRGGAVSSSDSWSLDRANIFGGNFEAGTAGQSVNSKLYLNNSEQSYATSTLVTMPDSIERTYNYIGVFANYNPGFGEFKTTKGDIPEVIVYNRDLAEVEQLRINSYLAIKYGLTLPEDPDGGGSATLTGTITQGDYLACDSAVVWDASKFSTYYNDLVGLGSDSLDMLIQKVSRSVSDSILIVASSADFVSSNLNPARTVWADSTFVVIGNDDADTLFQTAYYGKRKRRMNRVWAADVTGSPDSIFVAIPDSVEFPRGIPVVIVSDDANIKSRDAVIKLTEANGFYYAKIPVTANTDFYFTFGALDNYKYMRHGKHFDEKGKKREMTF